MREVAVTNSSCLIVLDKVERLFLLPQLFKTIHAPKGVAEEVGAVPDWLSVRQVFDTRVVEVLKTRLGKGEAEAIALGQEVANSVLVLDDKKARTIARQLGLDVIGTVGLLVQAKHRGLIPSVGEVFDDLSSVAFHVGKQLRQQALKLAGEI